MTKFNFGECWYIDLDPVNGHEQGLKRPVVIISNNDYNKISNMRLVVPISSAPKYSELPQWVENPWVLNVPQNSFNISGHFLVQQMRTVDMNGRAINKSGKFSQLELQPLIDAAHFSIPE